MINPASVVLGPLAGIECRRGVGRGWLIVVRTLAAALTMGSTLLVFWFWMLDAGSDDSFMPYSAIRFGLTAVESILLVIALVLSPSVLAGALAGDNERGALGLLLATRVSPREIVTGRLVGKLSQVVMVLLAGVPAVALLTALAGLRPEVSAVAIAFPFAVAFGGAGLATVVSAVSRRGRDALLTVYLLDVFLLMSPLAVSLSPSGVLGFLGAFNPFTCVSSLVWGEEPLPALISMGLWLATGLVGLGLASIRLGPSCLAQQDGARIGRKRRAGKRPPPIGDRPMLWKELYVERGATLGGLGRWLGIALAVAMFAGSVAAALTMGWHALKNGDPAWFNRAQLMLRQWIGGSATYVSWLIQWAVGLRAAVAVSSERERGTWDVLLTTPLNGPEILRAKLAGSLAGIRWLFFAAVVSWTVAAAAGGMSWVEYLSLIFETVTAGACIATFGMRASLGCRTATRAMAVTMGAWIGVQIVVRIVAGLSIALLWIAVSISLSLTGATSVSTPAPLWAWLVPAVMQVAWIAAKNFLFVLAALMAFTNTRFLFDRLAGRRAGGRMAVAVEEALHGRTVGAGKRPMSVAVGSPPPAADQPDAASSTLPVTHDERDDSAPI